MAYEELTIESTKKNRGIVLIKFVNLPLTLRFTENDLREIDVDPDNDIAPNKILLIKGDKKSGLQGSNDFHLIPISETH